LYRKQRLLPGKHRLFQIGDAGRAPGQHFAELLSGIATKSKASASSMLSRPILCTEATSCGFGAIVPPFSAHTTTGVIR
jgi:hypothetical protein